MSRLKARVQHVALAILLVSQEVLASESPVPDSARAALTRVMQARNAAQALAGPEASPQALRNAAAELERLSRLLDEQPYRDFSAADNHLHAEQLNIAIPLATISGYYAVLMRLAPLLQDGHTNIYAPDELTSRFYARPPIQTELVEEMVIIRAVHDPRLGRQLRPGDRILEIDGVDVKQYVRQRVQPFVSSSTEQDRNVRMYSYELLAGDQQRPLRLTILDGNGHRSKVTLVRSGSSGPASATFPFHVSSEGIAYLKLDHFESEEGVQAFLKALPQILAAKGLILDLRTNGGGSTYFGLQILKYLTNKPIQLTRAKVRFENQAFRAAAGDSVSWQPLASEQLVSDIPATQRFDGPVALLIGPKTFSAAEDFAAIFAQARRGMLVGETTAGSTGQALMLDLPGGGKARICVKRDTYADGTDFVGQGIRPTLEVKNTVAAVRNGTDPVLLEAQRLLGAVRVGALAAAER